MIHSFTALAVVASFALIKGDEWRDGVTNTYPVMVDDSARKAPAPISIRDLTILFANENYGQSNAMAFIEIIYRESRFQHDATNPDSGAYGLGQALPPEKMAIIDDDWKTNAMTQLKWVARYIKERYDTPLNALAHHDEKGWY